MLQRVNAGRRRILMTVDAVGGVWQYAIALTRELSRSGHSVILAGLGPLPTAQQRIEAEATAVLTWLRTPPDWMAGDEAELRDLPAELAALVRDHAIDLVHLNEPGQAAGLDLPCPVVAVSHSCIATWFRAVRGSEPPAEWKWQKDRARRAMQRADIVIAPSASHAAALAACHGDLARHVVVHNGAEPAVEAPQREDIVFAAGRWWDDGKNADVLDRAAARIAWPVFAAGATKGPNGAAFAFKHAIELGTLSHAETRTLAARCGIFVSPSLYEPFGLAALEAASAGTALVLADIPTYRELWSGVASFFPPRDADALVRTVNQLARARQLRRSFGAAAQRRSRAYTPARQAAAMQAAYAEAAAIRAGRV